MQGAGLSQTVETSPGGALTRFGEMSDNFIARVRSIANRLDRRANFVFGEQSPQPPQPSTTTAAKEINSDHLNGRFADLDAAIGYLENVASRFD